MRNIPGNIRRASLATSVAIEVIVRVSLFDLLRKLTTPALFEINDKVHSFRTGGARAEPKTVGLENPEPSRTTAPSEQNQRGMCSANNIITIQTLQHPAIPHPPPETVNQQRLGSTLSCLPSFGRDRGRVDCSGDKSSDDARAKRQRTRLTSAVALVVRTPLPHSCPTPKQPQRPHKHKAQHPHPYPSSPAPPCTP